jgi:pimeloyl-ACP methyl ester carboxylesterase
LKFFSKYRFWGVGLGAGLLGAVVLALRYAFKTPKSAKIPDTVAPAIFATRIFYTGRGHLVYHESGKGDPLVFIHGVYAGASSFEWSRVYPHFADRFQVLAPDLLGFGESSRPNRPFSPSEHTEILAEFLRAKAGQTRSVIVASGLGAAFATLLAERHPELIQRLVLLMPGGRAQNHGLRSFFGYSRWLAALPLARQTYYYRFLATKARIRLWLATACFADPEKIDDEIVDVIWTYSRQFGANRAALYSIRGRLNVDLERHLAEVTQPVTLVWGEEAKFPPIHVGHRLREVARQCNLVVLDKAGVFAALESPRELCDLLDRELDSQIRIYRTG